MVVLSSVPRWAVGVVGDRARRRRAPEAASWRTRCRQRLELLLLLLRRRSAGTRKPTSRLRAPRGGAAAAAAAEALPPLPLLSSSS